jgi:hypothetical protein
MRRYLFSCAGMYFHVQAFIFMHGHTFSCTGIHFHAHLYIFMHRLPFHAHASISCIKQFMRTDNFMRRYSFSCALSISCARMYFHAHAFNLCIKHFIFMHEHSFSCAGIYFHVQAFIFMRGHTFSCAGFHFMYGHTFHVSSIHFMYQAFHFHAETFTFMHEHSFRQGNLPSNVFEFRIYQQLHQIDTCADDIFLCRGGGMQRSESELCHCSERFPVLDMKGHSARHRIPFSLTPLSLPERLGRLHYKLLFIIISYINI